MLDIPRPYGITPESHVGHAVGVRLLGRLFILQLVGPKRSVKTSRFLMTERCHRPSLQHSIVSDDLAA